jgi:riboflavin synthase
MFTGIVTGIGRIVDSAALGGGREHGRRLIVETPAGYLDDVAAGDSIALNGACMTVTSLRPPRPRASPSTSRPRAWRTAGLGATGPVNLEKALRAHDRLGGHLVSGHVDGVGRSPLRACGRVLGAAAARAARTGALPRLQGVDHVNGVSLTVNRVDDRDDGCEFSINLIPHTVEHTTLGGLAAGTRVNLEVDLIARYVERMLRPA